MILAVTIASFIIHLGTKREPDQSDHLPTIIFQGFRGCSTLEEWTLSMHQLMEMDGNGPNACVWCCMERCFHIMSWYMMLIMLSITHVHRVSSQKLPQIIWKNLEFLGWTDLRFPQVYQHIIFIWGYECYDPLVTNSPTTHTSFGKLNPSS